MPIQGDNLEELRHAREERERQAPLSHGVIITWDENDKPIMTPIVVTDRGGVLLFV